MSSQTPEPGPLVEPSQYEAFNVAMPEMDLVQKGGDMSGLETRVVFMDE